MPGKRLLVFLAFAAIVACSQERSVLPPPAAAGADRDAKRTTIVTLVIRVPHGKRKRRHRAAPEYISPATASLTYAIDGGSPVSVVLATSNPQCTLVHNLSQCEVPIAVPPGQHTFSFATYDATQQLLSANTDVSYNVVAGKVNQIPVTLGGVAASLVVAPPNVTTVTGTQGGGFTIAGSAPSAFTITALDIDGYTMVGPGAPLPVISPAPENVGVTAPVAAHPNTWTLASTYVASDPTVTASATISVVATPVPNSGGTTLTATIPLTLSQPWLYVSYAFSNKFVAYDEAGNPQTLAGTFPNLNRPASIAYDPNNGWIYVANCGGSYIGGPVHCIGGSITAYDRQGNQQTLAGFTTVTAPSAIAFDPHKNWFYVVNDTAIEAYDEAGNQQTLAGTFPGTTRPKGITYDPHNQWLYVANFDGNNVTAYDEQGNQQTLAGAFTVNTPVSMAYDPLNQWIYTTIANPFDTGPGVTSADEQGNLQTPTFHGINAPYGVVYDPYQDAFYASDIGHELLLLYNPAGKKLSTITPTTGLIAPEGLAVVP